MCFLNAGTVVTIDMIVREEQGQLTSDRPSHCTWAWIHSRRSEFSFSRTPSFTWEHSSSAFSRACFRWLWSGWFSGVFSRICVGEQKATTS